MYIVHNQVLMKSSENKLKSSGRKIFIININIKINLFRFWNT